MGSNDFLNQFSPLHRHLVSALYREAYKEFPGRRGARKVAENLGEMLKNLKSDLDERVMHSPHEPYLALLEMYDSKESREYAIGIAKKMKTDDEMRAKAVEVKKEEAADEWKKKRMLKSPPSEKQLNALKRFGVKVMPLNAWDASVMLDEKIGRLKKNAVMAG